MIDTTRRRWLALGLAAALAPAAAADAVRLRYRATPGAVTFRVTGEDTVVHEGGAPGRTEHRYELAEVFERVTAPLGEGRLAAVSTTRSKELKVDGIPAPVKFRGEPRVERFDDRGRPLRPRGRSPGEQLQVVFPEEAIEPGHTWSDTIPAAPGFPAPVEVRRKFLGVRTVQGHRAALVRSKAIAEGELSGGGRVKFQLDSELALGLDDGELVRVRTDARVVTHRGTPTPGGVTTIRRRTRRTVERARGR